MKVYVSVGDFTGLLRSPEHILQQVSLTGADGIELQLGLKSRWSWRQYVQAADKYNLHIASVHQPLWAAAGLWFDGNMIEVARQIGARHVTCHPLPRSDIDSSKMLKYFDRLAGLQDRSGVQVLLENMPPQYRGGAASKLLPLSASTSDINKVAAAARGHSFGVTLDIDHLRIADLQSAPWLRAVIANVANMHVSSFSANQHHLPLGKGNLQTDRLLGFIRDTKYNGQLTLEVDWPRSVTTHTYPVAEIADSVAILKAL